MYRITHSYKGPHLLDLNLTEAQNYKRLRISPAEILLGAGTLGIVIALSMIILTPDMALTAECITAINGDLCSYYLE